MSQVGEGIGGSGSKYRTLKQIEADKEGDDEDGDVDVDMDNDEEKKVAVEDGEITAEAEAPVFNEEGDAVSAASLFCDTIRQLGDVGTILGEAIVSFNELLCLTPRGRFELELHSNFFRLRGKTHDYKVLFTSIVKMFLVKKRG